MRRTNIILLLLLLPVVLCAQKQNNIWYFGTEAGVDFNSSVPQPLSDGQIETSEGCASIADRNTGKLLFYTNGTSVWNRDHLAMPNGIGLNGHSSSFQGVVIVPDPSDGLKYYIFTTDAVENKLRKGLQYSIVDMRADNGRGDVIVKNVLVVAPVVEGVCAVQYCGQNNYWVIAHAPDTSLFYSVAVTDQGVSTPVVSNPGLVHYAAYSFKLSHRGTTLAVHVVLDRSVIGPRTGLGLFTFDPNSGRISSTMTFPDYGGNGFCFSPDDSKLYAVDYTSIYQYEVLLLDSATIADSRVKIYEGDPSRLLYDLQVAPNGKIYSGIRGQNWLAVIEQPNEKGSACSFRVDGLFLESGVCNNKLPNLVNSIYAQAEVVDTAICFGDTTILNSSGGITYHWSPADSLTCTDCPSPLAFPRTTTTYHLTTTNEVGCSATDSVTVTVNPLPIADAGRDTAICIGSELVLHATGGTSYVWNPAPELSCTDCPAPIARPAATTRYTVTVWSASGCSATDSVTVTVLDLPKADAGIDTSICLGGSVQLEASDGAAWQWLPVDELDCTDCRNPIAAPNTTTTYYLTVTNTSGCSATDSVTVIVLPLPVVDAGSDVALCPGESVTLHASGGTSYRWNSSADLSCTDCADPVASPKSTTRYYATTTNEQGCSAIDSVTVTVIDVASVDAGVALPICSGDGVQLQASDGATWQWSPADGLSCTDCRSPMASPSKTTLYTVTVSAAGGCSGSDTVSVTVLPMPVFAAGEDIDLCIGETARLHASGGVSYQWSPPDGLSCTDCADPVASPAVTTTYTVTGTSTDGCMAGDAVTVTVGGGLTVQAHIERNHHLLPGTSAIVPVVLDEPITSSISTLLFSMNYNRGMLRLRKVETAGTLLDGWQPSVIVDTLGGIAMRYDAIGGGQPVPAGTLLSLRFDGYVGDTITSELPFSVALLNQQCVSVATSAGRMLLDSICGLSYRMIEIGANKYALKSPRPNPFNPATVIEFSIGLDGPTQLEILNGAGEQVAVLVDEYMQPGGYAATWDAGSMPSGLYYVRLTSGVWAQTQNMVLVK